MGAVERQTEWHGSRIRDRLLQRGARRWYLGGGIALIYQVIVVVNVIIAPGSLLVHAVVLVLLALIYVLFLAIPPLVWESNTRTKLVAVLAFWALCGILFPFVGTVTLWVWVLVAAIASFVDLPARWGISLVGALIVAEVLLAAASGFGNEIIFAPIITASVGISLLAMSRQIVSNRRLRTANTEIARLAVQDERARFARDLHDILGHSLTVVTVKSELAGRLVEIDPQRAIAEIRDIEDLARQALVDLRSAVSSYREVSLASELASARAALAAASIEAYVPLDADAVDPELRSVFGWVVREGVTNVIRHSRAHSCWVELGHDTILIRDDGVGEGSPAIGNGLRGLGERAHAVGLAFAASARPQGGFQVSVGRAALS